MTVTEAATFTQEWEIWHNAHETRRADPHGFLAITGLHWLTSEPQRFDDAPGAWRTGPDAVTLDFNRAVNLPCAYTEFATCPLPPAGNRLAVAVEAGEKAP